MPSITVRTQSVPRENLAAVLSNNPRLVKLLENLAYDMTVTIPDAVEVLTEAGDESVTTVNSAVVLANAALALAQQADDLTGRVSAMEARLIAAERQITQLQDEPTP